MSNIFTSLNAKEGVNAIREQIKQFTKWQILLQRVTQDEVLNANSL